MFNKKSEYAQNKREKDIRAINAYLRLGQALRAR
ncbi:hypothetical protein EDD77_10551 [Allofournierella massiliensis]|uniref:Uncharacterized protein n=1 Tax=Allofournierella massiliensis TaxID=1650663 RepID=A0A4R1R2K4_9FIRM|nr:hypothetical protein EDD77_10551 [Fournierella massiliensis]